MERPLSLLVVEDEQVLRSLVAQFLRRRGVRVIEAADGLEAVDRFEDSGPFDLVLMDLNLPVLTGVGACRRIREVSPEQPILVCSAAILDDHQRELASLGLSQFLAKPFHPHTLADRILQCLNLGNKRPAAQALAASLLASVA